MFVGTAIRPDTDFEFQHLAIPFLLEGMNL
jgi:hypothetical protein